MLKITRLPGDGAVALKVEGKLVGPWVGELEAVCATSTNEHCELSLDLSAVTFVDARGVKLLRQLLQRGAVLSSCSGLVAEYLHAEGR